MTPKNETHPKDKGREPEWLQTNVYDWSEEEVGSSGQIQRDAVCIFNSRDGDDSHRRDKKVAGRKRQAAEMASDDKVAENASRNQSPKTANLPYDADNLPAFVQCKNEPNVRKTEEMAKPSPYGAGYFSKLPSMSRESFQKLMNQMVQESPKWGYITYTAPAVERSRSTMLRDAIEGRKYDESRVRSLDVRKDSEMPAQKQPAAQPPQPAMPPPQPVDEETELPRGDGDEAAADTAHDAPNWQELLNFMELSKSRLLESEPALNFLWSLEPNIIDDSNLSFQIHTLSLSLARMANILQRRERFEEYLVEARREWYCLTTVYKYGYEDENALVSEENCGCPQEQKKCLQVRIRRGKLGAFDVRFR